MTDLETHLCDSMEKMIEDEIEAASAFADWKVLTENEEMFLEADK